MLQNKTTQLTTVNAFLHRCTFVRPAGQPVLAQVEEGHGFEIQLAVWMGLGGHGHAVQKVGQHRVAGSGRT